MSLSPAVLDHVDHGVDPDVARPLGEGDPGVDADPGLIADHLAAEAEGFLESLTLTVLEILAGVRDLDQVARWVSEDVYRHLMQRVVLSARARQVKGERLIRPTFTIGRTLHSTPAPGVIEGVVIVHGKARTRAVALRLERLETRWRASAINVL